MQWMLLASAALAFAGGGYFMKQAEGLTRLLPSLAVFALFGFGAACQTLAMRRSEMGVVYLVVLGLEAVAAYAISTLLLREPATLPKVLAMLLILAGIAVLRR